MAGELRKFGRSRSAGQSLSPGKSGDARESYSSGGSSNAGWSIFGYLISGMAFYGGLGWLIGHWTKLSLLFPLGMLVGLGVGVFAVIYKYGRQC